MLSVSKCAVQLMMFCSTVSLYCLTSPLAVAVPSASIDLPSVMVYQQIQSRQTLQG
jgi:hypothetical protein